jgi:opacity protein-like surface antigen
MKKFLPLMLLIVSTAHLTSAQSNSDEHPKVEVFAGYSQNRIKVQTVDENNLPTIERVRFDGFNAEVTGMLNKLLGITGDISGHYRSDTLTGLGGSQKVKSQLYNFLAGPEVKARNESRVTPFVHALFGVAHARDSVNGTLNATDSRTAFAMALGGGVDVAVSKRVSLRLFQADYNPTYFGDGRQDNIRLSFGVVFK